MTLVLHRQEVYLRGQKYIRDVEIGELKFEGLATINHRTWICVLEWPCQQYWTAVRPIPSENNL
jgi:hypothetical protein